MSAVHCPTPGHMLNSMESPAQTYTVISTVFPPEVVYSGKVSGIGGGIVGEEVGVLVVGVMVGVLVGVLVGVIVGVIVGVPVVGLTVGRVVGRAVGLASCGVVVGSGPPESRSLTCPPHEVVLQHPCFTVYV